MAIGNQMDLVTESAQHAQAMSTTVASGLNGSATSLRGAVQSVIPARWEMEQSVAFSNSHEKFQVAMVNLIRALEKIGVDTGSAEKDYTANDTTQAALFNKIEAPPFSGQLTST